MNLSEDEKAVLLYQQNYEKQYPSTPHNVLNFIWQGTSLEKHDAKIALKKLIIKKMITEKPNPKKTEGLGESFDYIYKLTLKGYLYQFTNRWLILTAIGITITTFSVLITTFFTVYQYILNNPFHL